MKWKIDDDYTIEDDAHAFLLRKAKKGRINPETGKPIISKGEWWFPTLNMCLKKYVQECMKNCNEASEILELLEKLNAKIEALELPTFDTIKSKRISPES